MPSVSVNRVIGAPAGRVWAALSDIENSRRWNASWTSIEITSAQRHGLGTTFRTHTEDGAAFDFEVTEWDPPKCIAFSPMRDDSERYSITLERHSFHLRPAEVEQTHVELVAHAYARGIRGRFVALFFWPGYQKHGLNLALDSLQALFDPKNGDASESEPKTGATPAGD